MTISKKEFIIDNVVIDRENRATACAACAFRQNENNIKHNC